MSDHPTDTQQAIGSYIAQASNGSTASVNVYQYVPPRPTDEAALVAAHERLAQLPRDTVPPITPMPAISRPPSRDTATLVGRAQELRDLARAMADQTTTVIATTGIGGVGKTHLASAFAHRYGTFFTGGVFWVNCADPSAIPTEIAQCGAGGLVDWRPDYHGLPITEQVALVLGAWRSALPRLLIFDNCEHEHLLTTWQPPTGGCRVLITSRRQQWDRAAVYSLGVLNRAQSIALLRTFRPDLAADDPDLAALADELGNLPLALHVAGSFLQRYQHTITPAAYHAQLRAAPLDTLTRRLERLAAAPTGHDLDVARTFMVSYAQLDDADPIDCLARMLLARAACFAPGEPIPTEVLLRTLPVDTDPLDGEDALRRLGELGLLEGDQAEQRLHRLLVSFVRATVENLDTAQAAVEDVLIAVAENLNEQGYPARLLPLQTHLRYATDQAQQRSDEHTARLCTAFGWHLRNNASYRAAQTLYERALAIRKQTLGLDHPDTASSMSNLGLLLAEQGDLAHARPLYEQALIIRTKALPYNHPQLAQSMSNLALLLNQQGNFTAARPLFEQALHIFEQSCGSHDANTASSLTNLALLLCDQGDFASARPLFERALAIREHTFGPYHPQTAQSLDNLAVLFCNQGHITKAYPLFAHALAICEQTLGPHHPQTARSLGNLSMLLRTQGDYAGALPLMQRALTIFEHTFGPDHPQTAQSLDNLAILYKYQGNYTSALSLYKRALTIREHLFGAYHPEIANSLNNLALLAVAQGRTAEARPLFERALAICETSLGVDHPDTQTIRRNLATLP